MPTYEYRCKDCGHTFEIVQPMADDALTVCPECGGQLRKVFGAPMISFKGSGFYATDHGKKSRSPERAAEGKDGKEGKESKEAKDGKQEPSSKPSSDAKAEKKSGDSAPSTKSEPAASSKPEPASTTAPSKKKESTT